MALIMYNASPINHSSTPCGSQVLDRVLESTPFQFSVELAAIAARRDFLNLEKWLQDNLTIHRDSFFQVWDVYFLRQLKESRFYRFC